MDSERRSENRSENIYIQSSELFEKDLKSRLNWNREMWNKAGEAESRLHRLCNSLLYWKEKLRPAVEDVSIILTLYNAQNNVKVETFRIIEAIEALNPVFEVKGIANFRNPRYLCLYFKSKEIRDKVEEQFKMLENNFVVYLKWALKSEPTEVKLTVHWLPLTTDTNIVKEKLGKYVECVQEKKTNLVFLSGREMPTAKIEYIVKFKKDIIAEKVPHLMELNKMEALITISGRQPLCLNCDRLGHISKKCELRYCSSCRGMNPKIHTCNPKSDNKSYAGVLKNANAKTPISDPDASHSDAVIVNKLQIKDHQQILETKISEIESQLKTRSAVFTDSGGTWLQDSRKLHQMAVKSPPISSDSSDSEQTGESEDTLDNNMDLENDVDLDNHSGQVLVSADRTAIALRETGPGNVVGQASQFQSNKKKRKKSSKTALEDSKKFTDKSTAKDSMVLGISTKSYGKPVRKSQRKIKEEAKWNKLTETREFVFND